MHRKRPANAKNDTSKDKMKGKEFLTEGNATFFASVDPQGKISKELDVFYNPVMKFNRDISIKLLNALHEKHLAIADVMAGSGIRSIRFLLELKKGIIETISINDYDDKSIAMIKKNLTLNGINARDTKKQAKTIVSHEDANLFLLHSKGFNYIDIDPFGSPNDFLDSAIVRLARNGILAVTATDTAALCGTFPDACLRKYWAMPINNYLMHEAGLRILIRKIQLMGAHHEKALVPIYAYARDHYFRIFFRCTKGRKNVDQIIKQHAYLLFCNTCNSYIISPHNNKQCTVCNALMEFAGPLWTGTLCDITLAKNIAAAYDSNSEDTTFANTVCAESTINTVGFFDIHAIAGRLKVPVPNFSILMERIQSRGHAASRTHFLRTGIKTTMSIQELHKIIKEINP